MAQNSSPTVKIPSPSRRRHSHERAAKGDGRSPRRAALRGSMKIGMSHAGEDGESSSNHEAALASLHRPRHFGLRRHSQVARDSRVETLGNSSGSPKSLGAGTAILPALSPTGGRPKSLVRGNQKGSKKNPAIEP